MKLSIIIPASTKNKYSSNGDLSNWGETSLIEWKIAQAKKICDKKNIFISTNSHEIKKISKNAGTNVINRKKKDTLENLYKLSAKKTNSEYILWLNCTSPFLQDKTLIKFVNNFKNKVKKNYDMALLYSLEKEFYYKKNYPLNFKYNDFFIERNNIQSLKKVSNAAKIFKRENMLKKKFLSAKTYFQEITWLESLEIKESKNLKFFENILHSCNQNI